MAYTPVSLAGFHYEALLELLRNTIDVKIIIFQLQMHIFTGNFQGYRGIGIVCCGGKKDSAGTVLKGNARFCRIFYINYIL